MIFMGKIFLAVIALTDCCSGLQLSNASRSGLNTIVYTDDIPPADSASSSALTTLLPPRTKRNNNISRIKLSKVHQKWVPDTDKGEKIVASESRLERVSPMVSVGVRNSFAVRRSDIWPTYLVKNNRKNKIHKRNVNISKANTSAYTSKNNDGSAKHDNMTRKNAQYATLPSELLTRDTVSNLTNDPNDNVHAFMSVTGMVSNDSGLPAMMAISGLVKNVTVVSNVMTGKDDIKNDISLPTVIAMSETINETQQQNATQNVDTNDLQMISINSDDFTFTVKLGDYSFTVCSELSMCRNRCGTGPNSAREKQRTARLKRQIANSIQQSNEFESISQNLPELYRLGKVYSRSRTQTTSNSRYQKEMQGESEQNILSQKQTKTRHVSQQRFRQRTKRSVNGNTSNVRCTNNSQNYTCFCDESCVLYGDCCVDVFQSCFSKTKTADIMDVIFDIYQKVNSTTASQNLINTLENSQDEREQILSSFISNFGSCEQVGWARYVYLVSLCPSEFSDMLLRSKCEHPETPLLPPVTVTLSTGSISFKNIYCAQCHNFDTDKLQPWPVNLDCQETVDKNDIRFLKMANIAEIVTSKQCNASFTVPLGTCEPRVCEPSFQLSKANKQQIVTNLNNGTCSQTDAVFCQSYITGNDNRNPSCNRCLNCLNKQEQIINSCNFTNPIIIPPPAPVPGRFGLGPNGGILIILDITGIFSSDKQKTTFYVCADHEVFDPFFLQCKTLICSSGFMPFRGDCIDTAAAFFVPESSQIFPDGWNRLDILTTTSDTRDYISCGQIWDNTEAKMPHKHFTIDRVLINDSKDINGTSPENISTSLFRCEELIAQQQSNCLQSVDLILSVTHNVSLDTLEELEQVAESLIPLRSSDKGFQISVSNMHSSSQQMYTCTHGKTLAQRSDFSFVEYNGITYVVFNHTQQGLYYPLSNIGYELTIAVSGTSNNPSDSVYKVYICQDAQLLFNHNCSVVVYFLNETQQEGTQLLVKASNQFYNESDFYITGEEVYVCSKFKFKVQQENLKENIIYIVVTCVLTLLSVACLLTTVIIYCMFPELHSLPGKMSTTLAATMMLTFLASLFTLTKLHNDYICPVMAVISHVITLSHFGWMAAISVNMALTFGPGIHSLVRSCDDKKVYLRYSVVVWGLSLVIVLTSVILDFSTRGGDISPLPATEPNEVPASTPVNYPRYGQPFCTWFSGPLWARLSFVVVPYFLTYIVSTTGFILTLVGIQRSNKNAEKVGHKIAEKTLCLIYIKLSTAMGFAWILSIVVGIYPDLEVLSYLYVCLVLLQGVLLFLAFTVNRKVYSLIMKKYFSRYKTSSKDGTQISSVMTSTL